MAMLFDKCNDLNALDLVHLLSKAGVLPIALLKQTRGVGEGQSLMSDQFSFQRIYVHVVKLFDSLYFTH
jgi:hypothetical protein